MPQEAHKYKMAQRRSKPEARLRAMMGACQGMKECPHTGMGLPKYRMDGARIMMEFPKPKADDDLPPSQAELKQVFVCLRAKISYSSKPRYGCELFQDLNKHVACPH